MPSQPDKLIETLLRHCRQKPGMQETLNYNGREPAFNVLGGFLDEFAHFYLGATPDVLMLRCQDAERERLAAQSGSISVSDRMKWDTTGWTWTDVALDGTIPETTLLSLIDQSYQLVLDSDRIDDDDKHQIELIVRQPPQPEILNDLISWYGLSHRKKEIEHVARTAALLRTREIEESRLPLGQTKIGGLPDLPMGWPWPTHHSGKPLAFLAQINLSNIREVVRLDDLPDTGILYFFSAYGWQDEENLDPQLPNELSQAGWTQVQYLANVLTPLQRHDRPAGVNGFPAAGVEIIPTMSLPDAKEPVLTTLKWGDEDIEAYQWKVGCSFKKVCDYLLGHPADHLLRGYAEYEQEFVDAVSQHDLRLLFQLASDNNTAMCWGDSGLLYFWIKPEDLQRRDFSNIFVDYQCG